MHACVPGVFCEEWCVLARLGFGAEISLAPSLPFVELGTPSGSLGNLSSALVGGHFFLQGCGGFVLSFEILILWKGGREGEGNWRD